MSDPRRHLSRRPTSGSISALFKVRAASEPLPVHMSGWRQQSNRVSNVSECFDGGVTWCGARAQTAAISAQASKSQRLRQRPLPGSDATDCLRLLSCRSLPVRWQLDHATRVPCKAFPLCSAQLSAVWILWNLYQQSVRVVPSMSVPASCKGASLWSRSPHPSVWTRSLLCQANSSPTSSPVAPFAVGSPPPFSRFILHLSAWAGAQDEWAREGLGVRLCRGPGTRVRHLQRMAF